MHERTDTGRRTSAREAGGPRDRGVALAMVLVALAVTAALSSALIMSQRLAPTLGLNASKLVSARWTAQSAVNVAISALDARGDWASDLTDPSTLLDEMPLSDGSITVTLTDPEGNPPAPTTRELLVTATAEVDGLERTVTRRLALKPAATIEDAVDFGLSEFTIFAASTLRLEDGAYIGRWALSPERSTLSPVKVGYGGAGLAAIEFVGQPVLDGVSLFANTNGSGATASSAWNIPLRIPVVGRAPSAALAGLGPCGEDLELALGDSVTLAPGCYGDVVIGPGARATVRLGLFAFDSLVIDGGTLEITGNVQMLIRDDLLLDNAGAIALGPGEPSLRLFVNDDVSVLDGSSIGTSVVDADANAGRPTVYVQPRRVMIDGPGVLHGGSGSQSYRLGQGASVVASVHAPEAALDIESGALLMGRATGATVRLGAGAAVLACPTLDRRVGFTEPSGPLYTPGADPIGGLQEAIDDAAIPGVTVPEATIRFLDDWLDRVGLDTDGDGLLDLFQAGGVGIPGA